MFTQLCQKWYNIIIYMRYFFFIHFVKKLTHCKLLLLVIFLAGNCIDETENSTLRIMELNFLKLSYTMYKVKHMFSYTMLIHVLLYSFRSDDIDDMAFEEIEFGLEFDTNTVDEEDVDESHEIPSVIKISTDSQCDELSSDTLCLSFLPQLKLLADITVTKCSTSGCKEALSLKDDFVGSALYFRWVSITFAQPILKRNK